MRCINRIELLDHIRDDLIAQGREDEADTIDDQTTKETLCRLLSLSPETTSWRDLRDRYRLIYRGRQRRSRSTPLQCYLVDSLTRESIHFPSCSKLCRYLDHTPREGGSCIHIVRIVRQGGCIINHRGRDKYLVPNLDVDLSTLSRCRVRSLVIRLEAQNMGLPVGTYSTCRSILNRIPIVGSLRRYYNRTLYRYFGRGEEYEKTHEGGYRAPKVAILYSPDNVHIFMSRSAAADFLKISERTLEVLEDEGLACPYKRVYYRIEL